LDIIKTDLASAVRVLGKHLLLKGMIPAVPSMFQA
jgi:hypothetical protein